AAREDEDGTLRQELEAVDRERSPDLEVAARAQRELRERDRGCDQVGADEGRAVRDLVALRPRGLPARGEPLEDARIRRRAGDLAHAGLEVGLGRAEPAGD